jgi:hypothetical protein
MKYQILIKLKGEFYIQKWGPFSSHPAAEACLTQLAKRSDIENAWISEIEDKENKP